MGKLRALMQKLGPLPTCMEIIQEIEVINALMAIPIEDILSESDEDVLCQIIDDLRTSHMDACFGLTKENEGYFMKFCQWIEDVEEKTGLDIGTTVFATTYDDMGFPFEKNNQ
jgi:hypothetical protein